MHTLDTSVSIANTWISQPQATFTANGNFTYPPMNHVTHTLGSELLQASSIRHYQWPSHDPRQSEQSERLLCENDKEIVLRAATSAQPNITEIKKRARSMSLPETILHILTRRAFNFNGPQAAAEGIWQERVRSCVERGLPIPLVYPLIAKIGCWAKQMTNIGTNAGELASLYFFNHVNRFVKEFYEPGIVVELVCDGHLYNSAVQLPHHEVAAYMSQVEALAREVAPESVRVHDFSQLIQQVDPSLRQFRAFYEDYHAQLRRDPDCFVKNFQLWESMRACVNTRRLGLAYDDHRSIFGNSPYEDHQKFVDVEEMTRQALFELLATRMACAKLRVLDQVFPDMVRVSCHRGLKDDKSVIGLRVYPEYYRRSAFLPYHGIAVLKGTQDRPSLEIHPEVVLRGDPRLTRVVSPNQDVFYYDAIGTTWTPPLL